MSRVMLVLGIVIAATIMAMELRPVNRMIAPSSSLDAYFSQQASAFSEQGKTADKQAELKAAQDTYTTVRGRAREAAATVALRRDRFSLAGHILAAIGIVVAFSIPIVSAVRGVRISPAPTADELAELGKRNKQTHRSVLVLSAIAGLMTAAADRVAVQTAELKVQASAAIDTIAKSDERVVRALNAVDIDAAAHSLDLDILRQ